MKQEKKEQQIKKTTRQSTRIRQQKLKQADSVRKTRSADKNLQTKIKKNRERLRKHSQKVQQSINKSYKLARLNRSKGQRIFLMKAERFDNRWEFVVEGTTGNNYRLLVSSEQLKCGCLDFRLRHKTCKHLYFIITQVAQNDELTKRVNTNPKMSKNAYNILDMQLMQRLRTRLDSYYNKQKQSSVVDENITFGEDNTCAICFDDLTKEDLTKCQLGCKKYFHNSCMQHWLQKNQNCPLCRSQWKMPEDDQLLENDAENGENQNKSNALKKLKISNIALPQENKANNGGNNVGNNENLQVQNQQQQ